MFVVTRVQRKFPNLRAFNHGAGCGRLRFHLHGLGLYSHLSGNVANFQSEIDGFVVIDIDFDAFFRGLFETLRFH